MDDKRYKPALIKFICIGTRLVSGRVFSFPLLGDVEAEVLQQDDGPSGGVGAGSFHVWTHTVLQEGDVPAETRRGPTDSWSGWTDPTDTIWLQRGTPELVFLSSATESTLYLAETLNIKENWGKTSVNGEKRDAWCQNQTSDQLFNHCRKYCRS